MIKSIMNAKGIFLGISMLGLIACSESKSIQEYKIIPLPNEITNGSGKLTFTPGAEFQIQNTDSAFSNVADQLQDYLIQKYQLKPSAHAKLVVAFEKTDLGNPEAYRLNVAGNKITIQASAPNGAFYAFQTLRQMLPSQKVYQSDQHAELKDVDINDAPRFGYRGTHLDVARHFVTADSVKRFIDILAMHKMNTFHWHLTDDQGWRLEIKKYPELTEKGSKRKRTVIGRNSLQYDTIPHGGFYTQDEVRDIVDYASKRYITVVPEVDLPGHMLAALATFPELGCTGKGYEVSEKWGVFEDVLCAGNPKTLPFIYDIFDEVLTLFPSHYIHVGGDECPKDKWEDCPKCQSKIRQLGLKDDSVHTAEQKLQSFITQSVEKYLNERGRSLVGWDEILEGGISPNATLMAWRGSDYAFEAAKLGNKAILCPNRYYYLDYYQSEDIDGEPLAIGGCSTIEQVYNYQPVEDSVPQSLQSMILGIQANLWTEYVQNFNHAEYMLLPRLAAVSETAWSNSPKDLDSFLDRLASLTDRYDDESYNYGKHIFDVRKKLLRDTVNNTQSLELSSLGAARIYYTLDGSEPTENSALYKSAIPVDRSMQIRACVYRDGKQTKTLKQDYSFNKATLKPIKLNTKSYHDYTFEGASILNDGLCGEKNYRSGYWIGFNNEDLSATIDMLKTTEVDVVGVGALVSTADWVFRPASIRIAVSDDGKEFKTIKEEKLLNAESDVFDIERYLVTFEPVQTRFVRVELQSLKQIPDWHPAKGKPAFLFVDEISIL